MSVQKLLYSLLALSLGLTGLATVGSATPAAAAGGSHEGGQNAQHMQLRDSGDNVVCNAYDTPVDAKPVASGCPTSGQYQELLWNTKSDGGWEEIARRTVTINSDGTDSGGGGGSSMPKPTIIAAPRSGNEIVLNWKPVPNADGYNLYIGETYVDTVTANVWRIASPVNGQEYGVSAFNKANNDYGPRATWTIRSSGQTPHAQNLHVNDGGNFLFWDKPAYIDDVAFYRVFKNGELYKEIKYGSGTTIDPHVQINDDPAVYWVESVSSSGLRRTFSELVGVNDDIIEQEGYSYSDGVVNHSYGSSHTKGHRASLLVARVKFNQTGDPTVFDQFNTVGASLAGAEKTRYDEAVLSMRRWLRTGGADHTAPRGYMDNSMNYMLSSLLIEAFWPNEKMAHFAFTGIQGRWGIRHTTGQRFRAGVQCNGENIFGSDEFLGTKVKEGTAQLDIAHVVDNFVNRGAGSAFPHQTVVHEAAHAMNCQDFPQLVALSGANPATYEEIRQEMRDEYAATGDVGGLSTYAFEPFGDNGGRSYNQAAEFWAESIAHFTYRGPRANLFRESPELYNWLRIFFRWTHLPVAPV